MGSLKPKIAAHITIDELCNMFEIRGADVVWKNKTPAQARVVIGLCAGTVTKKGYLKIGMTCKDGIRRRAFAHHIAFAIAHARWSEGQLDHKDGVKANNTPDNLREATDSENASNRPVRRDNVLGVKGVYPTTSKTSPYLAQVMVKGAIVFTKCFTTLEEATIAVQQARAKHHGEFVRHA